MQLNEISGHIVDSAIRVHSVVGPGLLESAYHACLSYELRKRGLHVESHVPLGVTYEAVTLDVGYRLDLLVESMVIVEIKAVKRLTAIHTAQLLSYLRLSACPLGLLLNFHEPRLKHGIMRIINDRSPHHLPCAG